MTSFHAFLGCSLDGFIAGPGGELDWLTAFDERLGESGYTAFFSAIDALVMGRATYETMQELNPDNYDGKPIFVLSRTLPAGTRADLGRSPVRVLADVPSVRAALAADGVDRAYVDGGRTVQTFIADGLLSEIVITRVPVLIGAGIPLFGPVPRPIGAELVDTRELDAGAVQSTYRFAVATG